MIARTFASLACLSFVLAGSAVAGQKTHPTGLRLGISKGWESKTAVTGAGVRCIKTGPGVHKCKCTKGYARQDSAEGAPSCTPALKTGPGKHVCKCKKGFVGDGTREAPAAGAQGSSAKTGPGTHKCVCKPKFKGDRAARKSGAGGGRKGHGPVSIVKEWGATN